MSKNTIRNEEEMEYSVIANKLSKAFSLESSIVDREDSVIKQAIGIIKSRLNTSGHSFTSPESTRNYVALKCFGLEREEFGILLLTNKNRLIADEVVSQGTIDSASVYPREVVKMVLKHNAAAVIFYHNHPSGLCSPSAADDRITKRLKSALDTIDVRSLDHIVAGGADTYSYAEHGKI